jgi:hypothetical protein
VQVYLGSPGRTVWAQSRQMKRPSLKLIIGLNSMPTMQFGQRITKVVSVGMAVPPVLNDCTQNSTLQGPPCQDRQARSAVLSAGVPISRHGRRGTLGALGIAVSLVSVMEIFQQL